MMEKKIAIDLTWIRHKKVGGTEAFARNLIDGLASINGGGWCITLLLSIDNYESFMEYSTFSCFELDVCRVHSLNQVKRVAWQNAFMTKHLLDKGIYLCYEPIYGKPFCASSKVRFITTIHDLQALHFPEYFSRGRIFWMKLSWDNAVRTSDRIVAISEYVKKDIEQWYPSSKNKIRVIYNSVNIDDYDVTKDDILKQLDIESGQYYYTVSSLLKHKNLKTIVLAISELRNMKSEKIYPLVISGVGGNERDELLQLIDENSISEYIIFTPFVSNEERNALYRNCKAFLFPSIFEGFGMPPIEAACFGVPVITTKHASLYEVTCGLMNYIDDAFNAKEWAEVLDKELYKAIGKEELKILLQKYSISETARKYVELFDVVGSMINQ